MTSPGSPTSAYMLFFRNTGADTYRNLSPEQTQDLVTRWNDWFETLVGQGKAVEGQPLEPETRLVSGAGGSRVTDGPFPEAKEAIGGYVLLTVGSFDEAVAIAQKHPGLVHGLKIEVRQLTPDCHMGVRTRPRQVGEAAPSNVA